jgi:hypothetical protein
MSTFTITTPVNISSLTKLGSVAGLTWTRATTTATVTQTAHGMVTGDLLSVTVTSDAAAIVLGVKNVTVVNANTYTFVCLNAGAASGTITAAPIDDYLINGGYLTIDQHSRYGAGQSTSSVLGDVAMSSSLGGTVEVNSTLVRLIQYNTGTGNVPALDTIISQGSASGKLMAVYSALNVAPTAVGAAMPASGFILIRQWNSVPYAAGALTGIGATATTADRAGWLEIVGAESVTMTVNRLNLFKVRGDYFDLGTTDGTRATTYQIPSNGSNVYVPGVEVETGVGTGIYEYYPCAGTRTALAANIATDSLRGKWCWVTTAGLLRFGHDGTNSTGGYIPPAGLKIRIANIFFQNCTQAALTNNVLPNATATTRYEFATNGGGVIDIEKANFSWYLNFTQPFSVTLSDVSTFTTMSLIECASSIAWSNVNVGQEAATSLVAAIFSLNFAGGTLDKCTWSRAAQAASTNYITQWTDCSGFTVTNERVHSLTKVANSNAGSMVLNRINDSTWTDTTLGGGRVAAANCSRILFKDTVYYDHPATTTVLSAIAMFVFDLTSSCVDFTADGLSFGGLTLVQPAAGVMGVGVAGCTDIKLRNIGTPSSPLNMGGDYVADAPWTRVTTTMTVTKANHGLKVGDSFAVDIISDVSALALTTTTASLKTVLAVPTANTFTVTSANAGATSGTLSYYPAMAGSLCVFAAGAAANNVKIQRCYTRHLRTGLGTSDNSSKNIVYENVWGTDWGSYLVPMLNCTSRGLHSLPVLTAQTSTYGTHFIDFYISEPTPNLTGVSWTRSAAVATITSNSHRLRSSMQVVVTTTSDSGAIVRGVKTITATGANTFTFPCANAGATSGTLDFLVLNGRFAIQMNEPTLETVNQVTLANGAQFTSVGSVYMPVIGQQADFTLPVNLKGHSLFPISEAVMGTGSINNYDITYSLDNGLTYKNLSYPRAGAGGSNGSTNITMTSTVGVNVGDYVFGTNVGSAARVSSITNATTIVVDTANTGTVSGILRFNHLPNEVIANADTIGTPLRVRIVTTTTNSTTISSLYVNTFSNSTDRQTIYPLDLATLTLTNLIPGSDIVILQPGTSVEYVNSDANPGTTFEYEYEADSVSAVDIAVYKAGYVPFFVRNFAVTASGASLPIAQVVDRAYA